MMRRLALVAAASALAPAARAQTHAVKKPETVVRAVAVYEWTGPEAKPVASRIVPVSLFINGHLEDAGVYMARPVPFALGRGNIFEAQKAGVPEGTLELAYQQHLEATGATPFDDGWLGFAPFKPNPNSDQTLATGRKAAPLPQVVASGGSRPHFSNSSGTASSSTANSASGSASTDSASADPNKPGMQRRPGSGDDSTSAASSTSTDANKPVLQKRPDATDTSAGTATASTDPAASTASSPSPASDDPNRPVLERRPNSSDTSSTTDQASTGSGNAADTPPTTPPSGGTTASSRSGSDSSDDADRPTLKKRTPQQAAKNDPSTRRKGDQASIVSTGDLNADPDRPTLHRGVAEAPSIVPLTGLPADMQQMVAISDARDRPVHDFTRPWESDSERADLLERMQDAARARLAKYDMPAPTAATPAPAPAPTPAKTGTKAKKPAAPAPPPPAPVTLSDETLKGYTLSYGGAATFVYTASSPGTTGATRYITIVAQQEPQGELKVALASITDSQHLDRTPWLRLVDAVDAEASNRASLLFEMRAAHARQFALYRVIGAQADQTFETGTTE